MSQLELPAGGLTGRVTELGFLRGFFGQAMVSGGALVLTGDPPGGAAGRLPDRRAELAAPAARLRSGPAEHE